MTTTHDELMRLVADVMRDDCTRGIRREALSTAVAAVIKRAEEAEACYAESQQVGLTLLTERNEVLAKVTELEGEVKRLEAWHAEMADDRNNLQARLNALESPVDYTDFDTWYDDSIWGNEDFKEGCARAFLAGQAIAPGAAPSCHETGVCVQSGLYVAAQAAPKEPAMTPEDQDRRASEEDQYPSQAAVEVEPDEKFYGLPFNVAKQNILNLNEVDAKGIAISLMIQNRLLKKQAAPKPLTEKQRKKLWHGTYAAHSKWSAYDWFSCGIERAEQSHGITASQEATHD